MSISCRQAGGGRCKPNEQGGPALTDSRWGGADEQVSLSCCPFAECHFERQGCCHRVASRYHTLGCHRRLKDHVRNRYSGATLPTLRAWWVRLFSRSHKCGAGEFLESWYSLPPHGTWLILYLSAKVSVRRFLSHIFGIVRVSKSMGLEFACSLHMSV